MYKRDRNARRRLDFSILSDCIVADLSPWLPDSVRLSAPEDRYQLCSDLLEAAVVQPQDPATYAALRQVHALYHKNIDFGSSTQESRRSTAHLAFIKSERKCSIVNKRLDYFSVHPSRMSPLVGQAFNLARSYIGELLGDLTSVRLRRILGGCGFGPGTTFGAKNPEHRALYYKLKGPHTITASALPYFKLALKYHFPLWKADLLDQSYEVVEGNRIAYVPKSNKTERTIAVEPSLNTFLQKGVESYLARCLRRVGINLRDQKPNQDMAYFGSCSGRVATVDLSAASDSVSTSLVNFLIPYDWAILLDDLRSPSYTLDKGKTWVEYSKFSSMGNACTFPLETLIFWSLAKACLVLAGGNLTTLRVYGDDITIDTRASLLLLEVFKVAGFAANLDKTFIFGPFRESCGADFYMGIDVRPVYMGLTPRDDVQMYNLFNRLYSNRFGFKLDRTLGYIYSCAQQRYHGPTYLPSNDGWENWYAGKARVYDSYFFAPPILADRRRWDPFTQSFVYKSRGIVRRSIKADQTLFQDSVRYLCFLLGLEEGNIYYVSKARVSASSTTHHWWPEMSWLPSCYQQ